MQTSPITLASLLPEKGLWQHTGLSSDLHDAGLFGPRLLTFVFRWVEVRHCSMSTVTLGTRRFVVAGLRLVTLSQWLLHDKVKTSMDRNFGKNKGNLTDCGFCCKTDSPSQWSSNFFSWGSTWFAGFFSDEVDKTFLVSVQRVSSVYSD